MNVETGKVYTGAEAITAAEDRGEKLTPVSARVANMIGRARADRARKLKTVRRRRDRLAMASRRANR